MQLWTLFALGTVLCWGLYGPTLHDGQNAFASEKGLRAIFCVGIAYFLVAVLVPGVVLAAKGQVAGFNWDGTKHSTFAGILGALGALCITWALVNDGKPFIVMPLVFAGAPIVNTIASIIKHPPAGGVKSLDWRLYVGFVLAAVGAYLVLAFKPKG
jgi:hypothetical protein